MNGPAHGGENAQEFYDDVWRNYGHLDAVSPASFHRRRLIVRLVSEVAPRAQAVLDVGCGQGELVADLARALPHSRIYGADLSEQSLSDTRRKHPRAELIALDLLDPEFENRHAGLLARFDVVVCSEVIEHVADDSLAVRRLCSLLAAGGHLVVSVPGGKMSHYDMAIGHQRHYSSRNLSELLARSRLEVLRVMAWGFPFHNAYRIAVRLASKLALARQGSRAGAERNGGGAIAPALATAYSLFGIAMKPLFFLNASRFGEQIIALARKLA
jgi:2-polyprenyl-3-methyl-5-hydroxy-6-metoxy-1,4-benzoquinol methylase